MGYPKRRITVAARQGLAVVMALLMLASCQRPFFDEPRSPEPAASVAPAWTGALDPSATPADAAPPRPQPLTVTGSDLMIRPRAGAPAALGAPAAQGEVTLNFVDADLREVLRAVLGDTLGRNFVVDPSVQGTVTLRTSQPIPISGLLATVEDILALNNAALITADGIYKVVPADQVLRGGRPRVVRPSAAGRAGNGGLVVVPLRYAAANDMARVLQPLAQPNGTVTADPERNVLLLGGTNNQVAGMLDLVDTFDVDMLAGKSFGLFPIETTDAETMVANLEEIFGSQEEGPLQGVLRLVPIERLNAVLVISARAAYLERARDWIARLDAGQEEVPQIFVFRAENSRAADLANVLTEIFPAQESTRRGSLAPGLTPTQLRGTGTSGASSTRRSQSNQPPRLSTMSANALQVASLTTGADGLQIGQVDSTPSPTGTGRGGTDGQQTGQQRQRTQPTTQQAGRTAFGQAGIDTLELGPYGEVRIVADDVKNSVVIYAKPRAYRLIEQALRKLDTVPMQVLIEATILEVVLNDLLKYGVEWFFHRGDVSVTSRPAGTGLGNLAGVAGNAVSSLSGFTFLYNSSNVKVLVNALDQVTDVNVISSPQVFVLDNQTAAIQVGDQVPTVTQQSQSTIGADSPIVNSVQYVDTGVILNVTPRVNRGGLVSMDIVQEVSDAVQTETSQLDTPTIQTRRIESSVAIQSGETVTLGGLIRDRRTTGSSGIPFLSRIPVVGALFGTKEDNATRTELLVLITPRVVPNQEEAQRVTDELRQRVRRVLTLEERIR
ncbi:MAG: type II secretion system secretin GspD [Rhodospirillales bacterium]|nr:type II secretion system secretin GspD [Rhodospirillales bacterium]